MKFTANINVPVTFFSLLWGPGRWVIYHAMLKQQQQQLQQENSHTIKVEIKPMLVMSSSNFWIIHIYFELGSYHAKLEGNFHDERDISVGDEFSACIWFKTVEGAWRGNRIRLLWLYMTGMNMLIHLTREGENIMLQSKLSYENILRCFGFLHPPRLYFLHTAHSLNQNPFWSS